MDRCIVRNDKIHKYQVPDLVRAERSRILRMRESALLILVIMTIAMSVIPVLPIYAIISIDSVSAPSGDYGDTIEVCGSGVAPGVDVNLYWDAVKAWDGKKGLLNTTEAGAYGDFEVWFDVPEAVNGSHYLWAKDTSTGLTVSYGPFWVVPKIELSPSRGLVGDIIYIYGYGFGEEVDVTTIRWGYPYGYAPIDTTPITPETDTLGSWEATFKVPSGFTYGDYTVYAEDESGFYDMAIFTVGAIISFDVDEGPVGTVVEVKGRGFEPSEVVAAGEVTLLDGITSIPCYILDEPVDVESDGEVTLEIVIPQVSDEDDYEIYVTDGVWTAVEDFEVTGLSEVEVDPKVGIPGMTINVEGWNFVQISGEDVKLELWDIDVTHLIWRIKTFETDSNGYFNGIFTVPARSSGIYTLVAAQDDYYINASARFGIACIIVIIIPSSGPTGAKVTITGTGFTEGGTWNAILGDEDIITGGDIDSESNLELMGEIPTFLVPTLDVGTYTLTINDITDPDEIISVDVEFTVTATTTVILNPMRAPNGYEIEIRGKYFSAVNNTDLEFVLYNVTDDGDVDEYWDMSVYKERGSRGGYAVTDEDGNFTGYWEVFDSGVLSLGDYWINVTDENDLFAKVIFSVCARVPTTIDIDPDTLNLKSRGHFVTVYIELPDGQDINNIDTETIKLTVPGGELTVDSDAPTVIGDYDSDSIPDLMVKFDRSAVREIIEVGDEVEITITGELTDGTHFEGSDTIRVIDKGKSTPSPPTSSTINRGRGVI